MSNQPGYKAVRRRRTPAHKEQTAGSADTTLLHTPQSSGTVVDDKSQSSKFQCYHDSSVFQTRQ